jgi:hypothetical protein
VRRSGATRSGGFFHCEGFCFAQARLEFYLGGFGRHGNEFVQDEVTQALADQGRLRLQCAMDALGYVPDLDHDGHVNYLAACFPHANKRSANLHQVSIRWRG